MTGKKTYLHGGRHSFEAGWARPLRKAINWHDVELALGRLLTANERSTIGRTITTHATLLAVKRESKVSAQDIKQTLAGIAGLNSDEIERAFNDADGWTQASIEAELARCGIGHGTANPAQITAAAKAALKRGVPSKDGRNTQTALLDISILYLWKYLGGQGSSPAARTGYATPIVRFASALSDAAGATVSESAIAARLRNVI
jgi:hypothetical protein